MPRQTDLPNKIINYIQQDPTGSRKKISQHLGVSYPAVQKHLKRLEKDGIIKTTFSLTEKWKSEYKEFWIFVETTYPHENPSSQFQEDEGYQELMCREIADELHAAQNLGTSLFLDGIRILLGGNWDIVLNVLALDEVDIGLFVTRFLRSRPDIVRTSTAWTLRTHREARAI